jgi:NHL repeat-containing protein
MEGLVGRSFRREISLLLFGLGLACAMTFALVSPAGAASGSWERAWGKNVNGGGVFGVCTVASSCLAGTPGGLGGEMNTPEDVAVDGAGNVYVADQNRIQKFDSSGAWQRAWGKNVNGGGVFEVCTVASSCLTGSSGSLGGEMNTPGGVATDASGNVYEADFLNHRIQKFGSSGAWQRAWGRNVVKDGGTGAVCTDAQAGNPATVCFEICTVAADCQAGTGSALGGEMNFPAKVATDASGNVYVADAGNQRIQKFNSFGVWERAWGKDVIQTGKPGDLGAVFEVCTAAADCQLGATGGLGGEMNGPGNVATDASGFVYVADGGNNRIQKFAASTGAWQRAWGRNVIQTGQPGDLGAVFEICTTAAHCQAGSSGGLGGEMISPIGVATDASDNVYVAESTNQRIQMFNSSGAWQRAWGKNVNGGGVFGICTVASSCLAGTLGTLGGEMNQPRGLATDASGSVYVAEFSNRRIQKFADPVVPPPPGPTPNPTPSGSGPTGQRAAALKKCKKKKSATARKKCKKKANKLPV